MSPKDKNSWFWGSCAHRNSNCRFTWPGTSGGRYSAWEELPFKTDTDTIALATYVDNIFSTGHSAEDAFSILQDCEHHLALSWNLQIGDDSKAFMCALGCPTPSYQTRDWAHFHGDTFTALGHTLADNGRIAPCFLSNMWKAFYGNFGKSMRKAPLETKLGQLKKCVLPIASYRMSRWPYQLQAAKRLDRTQTKMIRILMRNKMQAHEDPADYMRRSNRVAAAKAKECGRWSDKWKHQVTLWDAHLKRDRNQNSWAAKLLKYHDASWLQEQRVIHAVGEWSSVIAGRTGTRAQPGIVHKRWHDGVQTASCQ